MEATPEQMRPIKQRQRGLVRKALRAEWAKNMKEAADRWGEAADAFSGNRALVCVQHQMRCFKAACGWNSPMLSS